ncbi:MAG: hypothetical protein ACJA04_000631 [Cellvibrionaceae bacterium]|jgi:hypothetical protein
MFGIPLEIFSTLYTKGRGEGAQDNSPKAGFFRLLAHGFILKIESLCYPLLRVESSVIISSVQSYLIDELMLGQRVNALSKRTIISQKPAPTQRNQEFYQVNNFTPMGVFSRSRPINLSINIVSSYGYYY